MIIRILNLVFVFLAFNYSIGLAQKVKNPFEADSLFVYRNFNQCGTTANLWHNHKDLDSTNASKSKLSQSDLIELKDILKTTRGRKLMQQKYGGEICYIIVFHSGQKNRYAAYISSELSFLDDLDSMRRWKIENVKDRERFYNLIKKNWL
ncbi:MAG: hypothetical protein IT247_03760 [Bacteroidia bacterium]|nr:hypothetical protein [Bacteroidia bacterium]